MFGQPDTFSYDFRAAFTAKLSDYENVAPEDRPNDASCRRGHLVSVLLNDISSADDLVTSLTSRIAGDMADTLKQMQAGLSVHDRPLSRNGAELEAAIAKRENAWRYLAAILTDTELAEVRAAAAYPSKPEAAAV